jgi:hypothetical protein
LLNTSYLPAMVCTALVVGDPKLVERLTEGVSSVHPYGEHALVTVRAPRSLRRAVTTKPRRTVRGSC